MYLKSKIQRIEGDTSSVDNKYVTRNPQNNILYSNLVKTAISKLKIHQQ